MALSKRLFAIFKMVEKESVIADIGCDHALLPIALIQQHICKSAYACDLREGPLSRAKEAIQKADLQDKIQTLLRNGIQDLPNGIDTIIIAGMGFDTIKMILEDQLVELQKYKTFIIQSNTHVDALRQWIADHHFQILKEDIVEEDHFYEIISFSCEKGPSYSADEILFGVTLKTHPLFLRYWQHRIQRLDNILKNMPKQHPQFSHISNLKTHIETIIKTCT